MRGLSDNKLVYTVLNEKVMKPKTLFTMGRCDLECVPSDVAYIFDDINDICWAWEKMFTDVLNDHAPIKSIKIRTAPG